METATEVIKQIQTPHGFVELRSDNILVFRPDVATFKEYTLEILQDLTEAFVDITDGIPRPYMADNRYIAGMMNKEEQAFINENIGKFATRAALITSSAIVRVLVNSYTVVFKPKVKIKLFKTEAAAVQWLLA